MEDSRNAPAVIWSPRYFLDWPGHVFPAEKYRRVFEALRAEGLKDADWVEPGRIERADLLLAHSRRYVEEIERVTADPARVAFRYEIPLTRSVVEAVEHHCEGTRLAVRLALERGAALNLGGGFHHAFADRGEGFCFYNDVAIGLRAARRDGRLERAVVVDVDLHQGNGTAAIFAGDASVATYSIHQENLYPVPKERSTVDVGLPGGSGDREYLGALRETLPPFLEAHPAELLLYVAGADPFEQDQLGDLRLTRDGLHQRDRIVLDLAAARALKVAAVLAGGYAPGVEDVVAIHVETWRELSRFATRATR
jgi:acetoin utilization deacetylase AcuC-like enzyme